MCTRQVQRNTLAGTHADTQKKTPTPTPRPTQTLHRLMAPKGRNCCFVPFSSKNSLIQISDLGEYSAYYCWTAVVVPSHHESIGPVRCWIYTNPGRQIQLLLYLSGAFESKAAPVSPRDREESQNTFVKHYCTCYSGRVRFMCRSQHVHKEKRKKWQFVIRVTWYMRMRKSRQSRRKKYSGTYSLVYATAGRATVSAGVLCVVCVGCCCAPSPGLILAVRGMKEKSTWW